MVTRKWSRRSAGTDAAPASASARYRAPSSSDPPISSAAAATAVSSALAVTVSAGNAVTSWCTVAAWPLKVMSSP